ncbi:uncharacterized protein [Palaemon carinicauda]|uniref:uncharacterized protein n=1 Tax=Palaemon carinicauda TaxID=392227 RepID=UPI0035B58C63
MTIGGKRKVSELEDDIAHKEKETVVAEVSIPFKKKKEKKSKKNQLLDGDRNVQQISTSNEVDIETEKKDTRPNEAANNNHKTLMANDGNTTQRVKKKKKKKKNVSDDPDSTEGKRKLSDLGEDLSKGEAEVTDVLPPKKKKKRNKNKTTNAEKNGDGQQMSASNGVPADANQNGKKVKDGSVSPLKAQKPNGLCQEGKKKKKKKKKQQKHSTPIVTGGSENVTSSLAEGPPFSSLHSISDETLKAVTEMGFTKMTSIQDKAIPPLLEGKDVRGTAKTGSGKTLAFIIPVVERLRSLKFTPADGTGALIISPTRELSMQTFDVLNRVIKGHSLTSGILMGGVDYSKEAELLAKGINVLVATPGRLLSHLKDTSDFVIKNLACLVLDEADRILDVGFEKEVNAILELLPKKKQTMFFSATRDKKVNLLAKLSLSDKPIEVEGEPLAKTATVDGLEQAYLVCQPEKKFLILHNFLEKNKKKKIMVFFNTCNAVKFYSKLLNNLKLKVMDINGKNDQKVRTKMFYDFSKLESGILLCTDVAARGWDIPLVDWIIQFDPPRDPKEYIHRVGRTARAGGKGKALLFICEEEKGLLGLLKNQNVHLKLENCSWDKSKDLQLLVEKTVKNNRNLKVLALKGLASHLGGYLSYNNNEFMDIRTVNLTKLAKCFGYETLPHLPNVIQSQLDNILGKQQDKKGKAYNAMNNLQHHKGRPNNHSKLQNHKGKFANGVSKPKKMGKSHHGINKAQHPKGKFSKVKKGVTTKED